MLDRSREWPAQQPSLIKSTNRTPTPELDGGATEPGEGEAAIVFRKLDGSQRYARIQFPMKRCLLPDLNNISSKT